MMLEFSAENGDCRSSRLKSIYCSDLVKLDSVAMETEHVVTKGEWDLREDEIHLWLVSDTVITNCSWMKRQQNCLTTEELNASLRFYFARDREQYILTRAMIRYILSCYERKIGPELWRFNRGVHGKPKVVDLKEMQYDIKFNISHTQGLIAIVVSRGKEVGVDVENYRLRSFPDGLAEVFSDTELAALNLLQEKPRSFLGYEFWTLKEAFLKACGLGLSVCLRNIDFGLSEESIITRESGDIEMSSDSDLKLWSYKFRDEFIISVCAERDRVTNLRMLPVNVSCQNDVRLSELVLLRASP